MSAVTVATPCTPDESAAVAAAVVIVLARRGTAGETPDPYERWRHTRIAALRSRA